MARWEQAKTRVALEVLGIGKFVLEKLLRWTDHVEQNRAGGIDPPPFPGPPCCSLDEVA